MSFFVYSQDYQSGGNSSDGVWAFSRNLRGTWRITSQHMDSENIPWVWTGSNTMVMRIHDLMDHNTYTTFEVIFNDASLATETDLSVITTTLQNRIQATIDTEAILNPYAARTVTATLDGNVIHFTFSDDVDILWEGDAGESGFLSTINPAFGKVGTLNQLDTAGFDVTTLYMALDPKYLECYITESSTILCTSHSTAPTLLFSTRDGEFTGQSFTIPISTNVLTLSLHRIGNTASAVPLTANWYLSLDPVS